MLEIKGYVTLMAIMATVAIYNKYQGQLGAGIKEY